MEELLRGTLERILTLVNSRKFAQLKNNCKSLLERLPEALKEADTFENQTIVIAAEVALEQTDADEKEEPAIIELEGKKVDSFTSGGEINKREVGGLVQRELDSEESGKKEEIVHQFTEDIFNKGIFKDKENEEQIANGSEGNLQKINIPSKSSEEMKIQKFNESLANEFLPIFQEAVDTRKPAAAEAVLDCLQKLIAYRHLQGVVMVVGTPLKSSTSVQASDNDLEEDAENNISETSNVVSYLGRVIDLICKCEDIQDDGVELKIIKALLTAVTSTTFCIHNQGLLLAVRTCYNIFLTSRNQVNQTTSRASLTQMLNLVFQRMEANSRHINVTPIILTDFFETSINSSIDTSVVQTFLNKVVSDALFGFGAAAQVKQSSITSAFVNHNESIEDFNSSSESEQEQAEWKAVVSGSSLRPSEDMAIESAEQQQKLNSTEILDTSSHHKTPDLLKNTIESDIKGSVFQKDAFLVFRALCKLSVRSSTSVQSVTDANGVRGKVLALELIKILLENCGEVFKKSEKFISAIKQYLCLSLLKNCGSLTPQVITLSCSIFFILLSKLRTSLKAEIAVFYPMIVLKPIEQQVSGTLNNSGSSTPNNVYSITSFNHKLFVLRRLQVCFTDGQQIIDLFVNYDCDLKNSNLFERTVMALVRKAQGTILNVDSEKAQQQEALLREETLKCLNSMLVALIAWHTNNTRSFNIRNAGKNISESITEKANSDRPSGSKSKASVLTSIVSTPKHSSSTNLIDSDDMANNGNGENAVKGSELIEIREFKRRFQKGVEIFNVKPKKGVEYMIKEGLVGSEPEDIAAFFEKTDNLDKSKIGEYLGNREPKCIQVMHAYIDAMDFSGKDLDVALRSYLKGFRLPGEAPQIDRLMEKFAERYVKCNPGAFKSADVAYVLSYSMIMLNTDAHNRSVKNKMTKQDFLKTTKGINDGSDLPEEYISGIYDRIVTNEIKMRDDSFLDGSALNGSLSQNKAGLPLLDIFLALMPGRKQAKSNEPSDEAIKRTQEYLREKAKGATFFESFEADTVQPLFEVAWAPLLGAYSVLFEQCDERNIVDLCLEGFVSSICIAAKLEMSMLRNTFVTSCCRFTLLHNPGYMKVKNALALKAVLSACERVGNHMQENWVDVLRCVSYWEQFYQMHSGGPTDASLFAIRDEVPEAPSPAERFKMKLRQLSLISSDKSTSSSPLKLANSNPAYDNFTEISITKLTSRKDENSPSPSSQVLLTVDIQDINRLFVDSVLLDSEAIVDFVTSLCTISREELKSRQAPRVFSLTKIVEIAHFNMNRIRLVWNRIWAILSDFFIQIGCQENLQLSMYSVDSLRQLSMKFLERDELANYTFQNDFLKPFVVVMRQSKALEIRELIIRCLSQMVLARVANIKSGWKSMFMVFTTAAGDDNHNIVRLAFETIEKIVREHFNYITETETTTFTDCVNCLIAFTNNPHSLDVALNSIAFLRYCAIKLAEGSIGDVEELPEGVTVGSATPLNVVIPADVRALSSQTIVGKKPRSKVSIVERSKSGIPRGIRFIDKDEHIFFWFPLLAGLSELTFDPRQEIRSSALDVLFDTLKFHGHTFAQSLWARILDSVLLPIFDHVRAEVTDTTTFTDEKLRSEIDAWLYETCIKCLQHLVDLFLQFYTVLHPLLDRLFALLVGFMRRSHQSLASMGVAALVRLVNNAGSQMTQEIWTAALGVLVSTAETTKPLVADLIHPPERLRRAHTTNDNDSMDLQNPGWTLKHGVGLRRLSEVRIRAAVQLLTVQATGEIYKKHMDQLSVEHINQLLKVLEDISFHAREIDNDMQIRQSLAVLQAEDKLTTEIRLTDPPLLRLETEASHTYLSILLHLCLSDYTKIKEFCNIEKRLLDLCLAILERFGGNALTRTSEEKAERLEAMKKADSPTSGRIVAQTSEGVPVIMASYSAEYCMYSTLIVATLQVLIAIPDELFTRSLKTFFPLLVDLIASENTPLAVQKTLSEVFSRRIGPLLTSLSF